MTEKIPYWRSNAFLKTFFLKEGAKGCTICTDERVHLSLDRPPPPRRDQPPIPRLSKPVAVRKQAHPDQFIINVVSGVEKIREAKRKFTAWLHSPDRPAEVSATPASSDMPVKFPLFDIQDIPNTIRVLGMPKAAKVFDKWFAGELNYSPDDESSAAGINQYGRPFPENMIDRTSISLNWVLQFPRAKTQFELLQTHAWLSRPHSLVTLKKILTRYQGRYEVVSDVECGGDINRIHAEFQFQLAPVESSLSKKLNQFLVWEVAYRGIPDELSFIFGAFNFYAAVSRARLGMTMKVYLRLSPTFTCMYGMASISQIRRTRHLSI